MDIEKYANGKLGTRKQLLWNAAGTWPEDMSDRKQNPHGRPRNYYSPTVAGEVVGWEGQVGFVTKQRALEVAAMFQAECREKLKQELHDEVNDQ